MSDDLSVQFSPVYQETCAGPVEQPEVETSDASVFQNIENTAESYGSNTYLDNMTEVIFNVDSTEEIMNDTEEWYTELAHEIGAPTSPDDLDARGRAGKTEETEDQYVTTYKNPDGSYAILKQDIETSREGFLWLNKVESPSDTDYYIENYSADGTLLSSTTSLTSKSNTVQKQTVIYDENGQPDHVIYMQSYDTSIADRPVVSFGEVTDDGTYVVTEYKAVYDYAANYYMNHQYSTYQYEGYEIDESGFIQGTGTPVTTSKNVSDSAKKISK